MALDQTSDDTTPTPASIYNAAAAADQSASDQAPSPRQDEGSLTPSLKTRFEQASIKYQVPVNVLMAIAKNGSGYNPNSLGGAPGTRTRGIMDVSDSDAVPAGVNTFDPQSSINFMAQRLRTSLDGGASIDDAVKQTGNDPATIIPLAKDIANQLYPVQLPPQPGQDMTGTPAQPKKPGGSLIADTLKMAAGGAAKGTGSLVRGANQLLDMVPDDPVDLALKWITGSKADVPQPQQNVAADALENFGNKIQGSISQASKDAEANSQPGMKGFDLSTLTLGKDPSLRGYMMMGNDLLGEAAPTIVGTVLSGGGAVIPGAVAALQGGGQAVKQAHDNIMGMAKDGTLAQQSPYYASLVKGGMAPADAAQKTADAAGRWAFLLAAPVGMIGGAVSSKLIHPATELATGLNLASRMAVRAGLSSADMAAQNAGQQMATNAGQDIGAGTDTPISQGAGTAAIQGALTGLAPGAIGGALSKGAPRDESYFGDGGPDAAGGAAAPGQPGTPGAPPPALPAPDQSGQPAAPESTTQNPQSAAGNGSTPPAPALAAAATPAPVPPAPAPKAGPLSMAMGKAPAGPKPIAPPGTRVMVNPADSKVDPFAATLTAESPTHVTVQGEDNVSYDIPRSEIDAGNVTIQPAMASPEPLQQTQAPIPPVAVDPSTAPSLTAVEGVTGTPAAPVQEVVQEAQKAAQPDQSATPPAPSASKQGGVAPATNASDDQLYQRAIDAAKNGATTSAGIQKALGTGFNQSARLVDRLKQDGHIAAPPAAASRPAAPFRPVSDGGIKPIAEMSEPELRDRLKYIASQRKAGGDLKLLAAERKKVESALDARAAGSASDPEALVQPEEMATETQQADQPAVASTARPLESLEEPELRSRLRDVAKQIKEGGSTPELVQRRKDIERQIGIIKQQGGPADADVSSGRATDDAAGGDAGPDLMRQDQSATGESAEPSADAGRMAASAGDAAALGGAPDAVREPQPEPALEVHRGSNGVAEIRKADSGFRVVMGDNEASAKTLGQARNKARSMAGPEKKGAENEPDASPVEPAANDDQGQSGADDDLPSDDRAALVQQAEGDEMLAPNETDPGLSDGAQDQPESTAEQPKAGTPDGAFTNAADLDAHLRNGALGKFSGRLIDAGKLILHDDDTTLPESSPHGAAQGLSAGGKVHLVASNLTPETAKGALLHEAFHAGQSSLAGTEAWMNLMARMQTMLDRAAARKTVPKWWRDALDRVEQAGETGGRAAEELAAYAIENRETAPAGIREVADNLSGRVKAWALRRFGKQAGDVTPGELHALAVTALRTPEAWTGGVRPGHFSLMPSRAPSREEAKGFVRNLLSDNLTRAMGHRYGLLAAAPLRPLIEELGREMPAAREFLDTKQKMDALRSNWHQRVDTVARQWLKYRTSNRAENGRLMDLMHQSTLAQADPSEAFKADPERGDDDQRRAVYDDLRQRYDALSPEGQKLYGTVRDTYKEMADEFEATILSNMSKALDIAGSRADREHAAELQRIDDDRLKGAERDRAIAEADKKLATARTKNTWNKNWRMNRLRAQFETNRLAGPYFPLARFGQYFVTARDADGSILSFNRFEKPSQQRKFADQMKAAGHRVEVGTLAEKGSARSQVDPRFVGDVEKILEGANVPDSIQDAVWQRYLETMPDVSVRNNRIHRKGTAGFHADALRVFASNQFHASHQLARTKYAMALQEHVAQAIDEAKLTSNPVRAGQVANEMGRRVEYIMNPAGSGFAQHLTSAAFVYYLAASPASALVNVSQTIINGIPALAAFHGGHVALSFGTATAQLTKASRDFIHGKGSALKSGKLTAEEKSALDAAYDMGIVDRTQSHDLAGIGENGVNYGGKRQRAMHAVSWAFHQAERFNREVTFLAAYRMARAKGMDHEPAIDKAGSLTYKTHFDYQNTSRPRMMQGDVAKVALTFRNFNANMLYRLFRDTHQALNGASKEDRREALFHLGGMTAMMALMGGVSGTWLYGLGMSLAGLFTGQQDPQEALRRGAVNLLGPRLAGMVLDGIPGYVTGTSLSQRVGMPDLWFQSPDENLEGQDEYDFWLEQAVGAPFDVAKAYFQGVQSFKQGHAERGLEMMAPTAIRNLMKAYRYATQGATTTNGLPIMQSVSPADILKQALGFTPADLAEQSQINQWQRNDQQAIQDERQQATTGYVRAEMNGQDTGAALARVDRFNDQHPDWPITGRSIISSARGAQRAQELNMSGIDLNPHLQEEIAARSPKSVYR